MPDLLTLEGVVAGYAGAPVLHGVDLAIPEGEISVILGANGVGKTTTLRTAAALLRPWKGQVVFAGRRVDRMTPERLVREGVGVVPEPPAVFADLTVIDNLRVGGFALRGSRRAVEDRVQELLASFPRLEERADQAAGSLSGGERRTLALARALMGSPRLLLVDEASMGLSPTAVATVFSLIEGLRGGGVTVCMVEQNVSVLDIADRAFVMEKGQIVHQAAGDLSGVREAVTNAYLGADGRPSRRRSRV